MGYEQLSNVIDNNHIAFFPQDEFMTTEMLAMSTEFKLERMNTVSKILDKKPLVVVTNTTGFIKQLIPFSEWNKAIIELSIDQILTQENFIEMLINRGYQRKSIVDKQGEISVRGSIVDLYPINLDEPIRVDFFDDEIESIRFFDISSQRSTIKTKMVEIFPIYEFFYSDVQLDKLKANILDASLEYDDKSKKRIQEDLDNLSSRNNIDNLYRYMSFVFDKPQTISDYLGNHSVFFWDKKNVEENYENVVYDISEWIQTTGDYPKLGFDLVRHIDHVYNNREINLNVFGDEVKSKIKIEIRSKEITTYKEKAKLDEFAKRIDETVSYAIVGPKDEIKLKSLNLIVSDFDNSIEYFSINTIFVSERQLFDKKKTKKKR